jgi:hypothetical protein
MPLPSFFFVFCKVDDLKGLISQLGAVLFGL